VIRVFRILAMFALAESLLVCVLVPISLITLRAPQIEDLVVAALHVPAIGCSVLFLRVARRMARREPSVEAWACALSLLMMAGFPTFPFGMCLLPIFIVAGLLCYRKVKQFYPAYCEVSAT